MFTKFLRKADSETLTLEVIGLATGVKDFDLTGMPGSWASAKAARYAKDVRTILRREGKALDSDQRSFLRNAERQLESLSKVPDSIGTGKFREAVLQIGLTESHFPVQEHRENPEWRRQHDRFRQALAVEAGKVFDKLYSDDAVSRVIAATDGAEARLTREDPIVALKKAF